MHGGWVGGCDVQHVNVAIRQARLWWGVVRGFVAVIRVGKKNAECRSKIRDDAICCLVLNILQILRFAHASKRKILLA
ncbi:hypothetical protein ACU4GD_21850 [Cupriavidus basilensis]